MLHTPPHRLPSSRASSRRSHHRRRSGRCDNAPSAQRQTEFDIATASMTAAIGKVTARPASLSGSNKSSKDNDSHDIEKKKNSAINPLVQPRTMRSHSFPNFRGGGGATRRHIGQLPARASQRARQSPQKQCPHGSAAGADSAS
mmetsp:Transcript_54461/g.152993  ORF Transcript_54461/g.152993 Transcript_54461/m.152993 type:complete len:144 (-) Transcript_54461:81-512(-)